MIWGTHEEEVRVKYCGPWADWSGYGEANRNAITALYNAGVKVTTEKVTYTNKEADYGESFEIAKKLQGNPIDYGIKIIHVPSDGYLKFLEPTKYHIGHLFWETDNLSKTWVWNCNLMDEIWTGGEIHREHFRRAGVKVPIYVFPQAINTEEKKVMPFTVKERKGFMFYSIFQWIERKNPKALLRAYWDEFQGVDDVTLLLKVYRFGFGAEEEAQIKEDFRRWRREIKHHWYPQVLFCFKLMSTKDMVRLHHTGDCFISAHRGEGWGVPQAEAAVAGKPIISTNLGGIHEMFKDNETALLTKWNPVKVFGMDFAPWYEQKQTWAEVDQKDLRAKMRWVYENRDRAREIGKNAQQMAKNKLSYDVVGKLMKDRLIEIQRQL